MREKGKFDCEGWVPLPREFFSPSAREVAPALLGAWLLRPIGPGQWAGGRIVETEAYLHDDPACHAYRGVTTRNKAMYGPPGRAYVYFIYGTHWCCNAVCRPAGVAEAVLIRAVEVKVEGTTAAGLEWMLSRRPVSNPLELGNGPGKICQALGIDGAQDGADLCDASSSLWIAADPEWEKWRSAQGPVVVTTRIGLTRAAELPLRFYLDGSPAISRRARLLQGRTATR